MAKTLKLLLSIATFAGGVVICQNAFAGTCWNGGHSGTAPWTVKSASDHVTDSCAYADVNYCVNTVAATADRVDVPAGTCIWNNQLSLTKAVSVIGAGKGQTIINSAYAPAMDSSALTPTNYLLVIMPSTPADDPPIRFSGFTIDFGQGSSGVLYRNTLTTHDLTKVRLDHLALTMPYNGTQHNLFFRYGLVHGVMDDCDLLGGFIDSGAPYQLWSTYDYQLGSPSNFYFEDDTWGPYSDSYQIQVDVNGATDYSFRYNTITLPQNVQIFPLFQHHGNQSSDPGGFGAELYGNKIIAGNTQHMDTGFYVPRGGRSVAFYNAASWTTPSYDVRIYVREEHQDIDGPGAAIDPVNGQPQHVSGTYFWSNTKNGSAMIPTADITLTSNNPDDPDYNRVVPTADQDFWVETTPFDGTSGVGCGTLTDRPKTCTTGVGYWATDQNCSATIGMIGAHPSTPLAGTLYKCAATNSWTAYYTPYTYPHPLRTDCVAYPTLCDAPSAATPPAPPKGLRVR